MSTANLPGAAGLTQALTPVLSRSARSGAWGRIESWFRRSTVGGRAAGREDHEGFDASDISHAPDRCDAKAGAEAGLDSTDPLTGLADAETLRPRGRFSRRRGRKRSAAEAVQDGLGALGGLMEDFREGVERRSAQQAELLAPLAQLPEALSTSMRDSVGAAVGEAVGAIQGIQGQVERQGAQQWQIAEILERISRADAEQGRVLDALCRHESSFSENLGRVDENLSRVGENLTQVGENLTRVGDVVQSVGETSEAGARVLERLCHSIHSRDDQLVRAFKGHNARLTALLSISIGLSVVALAWATVVAAAGVTAFLYMHRMGLR